MSHILDYERASHIVEEAEYIGLGLCYCRHKAAHAGHPCETGAPLDVCLTFGNVARSLAEHGGHARLISREEAMDALERSYGANLVQIGENVREYPAFICNCCGCCCEALQAARRFAPMQPVATTNYIPSVNMETCIGCENVPRYVRCWRSGWRKKIRPEKGRRQAGGKLWWIKISVLAAASASETVRSQQSGLRSGRYRLLPRSTAPTVLSCRPSKRNAAEPDI